MSGALTRGAWMGVSVNDTVHAKDDPRHLGKVRAIFDSVIVRVVWDDTGWISDLDLADVVVVRQLKGASP